MKKVNLGFGCMRLPLLDTSDETSFKAEEIEKLFDTYLKNGFNYFDTAYVYHGRQAEQGMKRFLVDRYPRNKFHLATKLPLRLLNTEDDMERIFQEELSNCGVTYFDSYLLHNVCRAVYAKVCELNVFQFVKKKKDEGKIKYVGMSFHDTPDLLENVLANYGDCIDFVQLQINYLDWEQATVQSRKCAEVANWYNKPITVMEPCKGGTLVNIPEEAVKLMKDYAPEQSVASWAMRFAASVPGVERVLSGMNTMEQLEDNMAVFKHFKPLNEDEMAIIQKVTEIINASTAIQCTSCNYCVHDCPKNIPVPKYFALYNNVMRNEKNQPGQQYRKMLYQ